MFSIWLGDDTKTNFCNPPKRKVELRKEREATSTFFDLHTPLDNLPWRCHRWLAQLSTVTSSPFPRCLRQSSDVGFRHYWTWCAHIHRVHWTTCLSRNNEARANLACIFIADGEEVKHLTVTTGNWISSYFLGQTPKSDIQPNVAPKVVTPENYLQICDSSATLIGQLGIVTLFGAILGGIPLYGAYPIF